MIPMGRLSTTVVAAPYLIPDSYEVESPLMDYELGGIGLSDPSAGLQYQIWYGKADPITGSVTLKAPNGPVEEIFQAPGISELSFTFDQNMRPAFAYTQNGQAKFRWYDTLLGANRITDLGVLDRNPKCCLDDKRAWQTTQGETDIILAYMREGSLYYRQQRDRYEIEYLLKTGLSAKLLRVGMNQGRRLQFMLEEIA